MAPILRRTDLHTEEVRLGILALQGAIEKHCEVSPLPMRSVRYPHELADCDGLIIPGGESTTIWKQMEEMGFIEVLKTFSGAIFGTCAGLIIMARLGLLDIAIERNGYGRQIQSFECSVDFQGDAMRALFIRAPRIR